MPSLQDPYLKLERAREHLRTLDKEIQTFLQSTPRPYRGVREVDPRDGSHVWRLKIDRTPPDRLGVLVGDVVHNQRAALDHLAWQLALLTKKRPRRSTQFPIYLNQYPAYRGQRAFNPHGIKQMADIPKPAQDIIKSKQPYTVPGGLDPRNTPLWFIHELDIVDKHRLIPVLSHTTARVSQIHALSGEVFDDPETVTHGGVLNQGDEILRVSATHGVRIEGDDEPRFVFNVALGVEGPVSTHPVWEVFNNIDRGIKEFFSLFEPFFTGGHSPPSTSK